MASGKAALLLWTQNRTKGYNKVNITNFHTSWTDGLAFCALIHSHRPDLIDFSSLSPSNASENLRIAFSTAESLGIPRLLEVEDMVLVSKPEPLSIMTYLSQMYHYFKANPDGKSATVKPTSAGIASIVFEKDGSESKETLPATRNRSSSDAAAASQSLKPKSTTGNGTTWTRSEVSPKCARCHNPLSGVTVEAAGGMYHQDCFGCTQCGAKLDRVCLNVNNKPYCERCGRVAFVLKNRESMSLSSNKVKQLSQSTQEVQSLHGDGKPAETTKTETKKTEATKESSSSSSSNSSSNSTSSTSTSDMGAPKPLPKKKSKKTKPKGLSDDQPNLSSSSSSSSSLDSTPISSATDKPDSETKPPKSKKQKNTGAPTLASGSASSSSSSASSSSGSESGSASPATIKKKKSTKTTEGSSYKPKKASALAASSENPETNGTNGSGSGDSRRSRSSRQKGSEKTASKPSRTSSSKTKKVRQPRSQNQSEECTSRLRHAKSLPVVLERPTAPFDTSSTTSNPSDFSQVPFSSSSTSSTSSSSSFAAGGQPNVVDAISCSAPDPTLHHLYSMQNVNFDLDSNSSNVFGAQDLGSPVSGSPLLSYHHYLNRTSGEASFDSLLFPSGGESSDDTTTSDDQIDGSSSSSITTGLSFPSSVRLSGDLYHPDDNLLDDRGLIDPSMESSASSSSSSSSSSAASSRPIYVHPHMANSAYSSSGSSSPSQFDDRGSSLRIRTNSGPEDVGGDEEDLIKISKVMEERGELHVEQEDINSFIYEEHLNNLEGYLLKRHTNKPKKWSRRYFRLHNNRLIEYKDKDKFRPTSLSKSSSSSPAPRAKSLSPSTITLLSEVSCIIPIEFGESEAGGRDNVFQIEMAGKGQDSIFLAANSDIQMGLWVSAMYHSINQSLRSAVESESSSSAVASAQPKITQGVLLHKNRMKKWKPRWFSVSNGFLIGKKTSDDKKYKTKLPLFESTVEGYRPEKHNYSAFRLKSKAGQDIKLKASQEKDMLLWVNAILLEKHNVEDTINDITA